MVNNQHISIKDPRSTTGIFFLRKVLILLSLFATHFLFSQAKMNFTEGKKSFGTVKQGEIVTLDYEFTNTGTEPLIITESKVECSCTEVKFPSQPIAPGQKNKVTVTFNTKTVWELQDRVVKIYSNAKNSPVKIRFKGDVKIPK